MFLRRARQVTAAVSMGVAVATLAPLLAVNQIAIGDTCIPPKPWLLHVYTHRGGQKGIVMSSSCAQQLGELCPVELSLCLRLSPSRELNSLCKFFSHRDILLQAYR